MQYFTILLFAGILNVGCAQVRNNDLTYLKLEGNVASILVEHYLFEMNDSILSKKAKTYDFGEVQDVSYYAAFNKYGFYDKLLNIYDSTRTDTIYYKYDDRGFLISLVSYDTTIVKCNSYGNIDQVIYSNGSVQNSKYDRKGNIVSTTFSYQNNIESKYKAKFKNDQLFAEYEYDSNNTLFKKSTFKYFPKKGQVEISHFSPLNELSSKSLAQLDSLGNAIEISYIDASGNVYASDSYLYEFDNQGNWIKRFEFQDTTPKLLTERTIEYYK